MKKQNLLSIGELAKLSGASIRSLRYYEKIGLLTPVFVNPDSSYRYYGTEQVHHVFIIQFCIELDIPLKELSRFQGADDMIDFRAFLSQGREIATRKLASIQQGLRLITAIEAQIDLVDAYQPEQIYTRKLPKTKVYTKALGPSLATIDRLALSLSFSEEVERLFAHLSQAEQQEQYAMLEHGLLCQCRGGKMMYYAFVDVPPSIKDARIKTLPAGVYTCRQSTNSQIEQSASIFKAHLPDVEDFVAVETEIFTGKQAIANPSSELRVIHLS